MLVDTRIFKTFYETHLNAVIGFCHSYIRDRQAAMDITQETFFKLYSRWNQERFTMDNAQSFIYVTARNLCSDHLRKKKFDGGTVEGFDERIESDHLFFEEIVRQETINILRRSIEMLAGRNRQVIELTLHGKSNPEIAELLNISLNTVKWIKKEAYAKLRAQIGKGLIIMLFAGDALRP